MAAPSPAPVKIPGWVSLGQIISGIGAILMFIGFLFGYLAATNIPTSGTSPGNLSNYQADFEAFFVLTGLGILLAVGGWLFHSVWPKFQARPRPAPTYVAPVAPAPTAAAPAPPPPPAAAPAAPSCPNCGKPTTFIAQYGRYYCYSCSRYV